MLTCLLVAMLATAPQTAWPGGDALTSHIQKVPVDPSRHYIVYFDSPHGRGVSTEIWPQAASALYVPAER